MQDTLAKKVFAVGSAVAMAAALVPFMASADTAHSAGTNVSTSDGTVWFITQSGTRRAYTSAGAFTSYGFNSWSTVVPASAADLSLPVDTAGFIPPQDGKIFCATVTKGTDVKGECALISGGMKHSFTSAAVFTGLGFSFSRAVSGDSSFMSKAANVDNATMAHLPGVLVNNNGTVQLVGSTGLLGIPDLATFNTWGYSFNDVVKANTADTAMTQTGVMAARVAGQLNPTALVPCTSNCTPVNPVIPANGGALNVSASSMMPVAQNVPSGAAFLPFTAINFTAGSNPVVVSTVVVHRGGLGADSNLNNMYLFNGNQMIAQSSSIQNGAITFTNSQGLFTVNANTTMTIMVKGDLASGVSSGLTYTFGLNSASDITSNASSVSGTFPIVGNLQTTATVSSPALATLTAGQVTIGTSLNAGTTGFLAGQFSLQASNSSVKVNGITLTLVGSAAPSAFANVKLMANGAQLGSTMTSVPTSGMLFFDLSSNPLIIATGQTTQLQVMADVMGGVNRYFNFTIQHNYDIQAFDTTYNVGLLATAGNGSSSFPITQNTSGSSGQILINSGSLTMNRDASSRTTAVAGGMTNVTLSTVSVTANGEDMKLLTLPVTIAIGAGGTVTLNNIKLVDNQGYGLGTSVSTAQVVGGGSSYSNTFGGTSNLNYVIPANTTRKISIVADLTTVVGTPASITATLGTGTAQGVVSVANISTSQVAGNSLTISATTFTGVVNSGVSSPVKVVPGETMAKVASFALNAGASDSVNVTTITLSTAAASVTGNFQNLRLMTGNTQIGTIVNAPISNQQYSFSPSQVINVPAGGSVVVDVYVDVLSGIPATTFVNQVFANLYSVTAQLATSGANASISGSPYLGGQAISTSGGGTVAISSSPSTPVTRQVAMGSTGVVLGVIKFAEGTGNEAVTLQNVVITATATAGVGLNAPAGTSFYTLKNFVLDDGNGHTFTQASWSSGTDSTGNAVYKVTFNNVNITIPAGTNSYLSLTFKADVNTFNSGAGSNATFKVGVNPTDATLLGQSSQASIQATGASASNVTTVLRTTMTATSVASITSPIAVTVNTTGVPSTGEVVGIFNITANAGADVLLQTITLQQGGSAPTAASTTYYVYDASNGLSSYVGTITIAGSGNGIFTLNQNSAAADGAVRISSGSTKSLVIKADTNNFNTGSSGSNKSYSLTLSSWTFSDGTHSGTAPSGDSSSVPSATNRSY